MMIVLARGMSMLILDDGGGYRHIVHLSIGEIEHHPLHLFSFICRGD